MRMRPRCSPAMAGKGSGGLSSSRPRPAQLPLRARSRHDLRTFAAPSRLSSSARRARHTSHPGHGYLWHTSQLSASSQLAQSCSSRSAERVSASKRAIIALTCGSWPSPVGTMVIPETTIVLPLRSMPDSQFTVKKVNSQSKKSDKNVGKKTTFRGLVELKIKTDQ